MKMTFRWYGEEEIQSYVEHVHEAGLEVEVIESVNVHEDIKLGLPTRDRYIENYKNLYPPRPWTHDLG